MVVLFDTTCVQQLEFFYESLDQETKVLTISCFFGAVAFLSMQMTEIIILCDENIHSLHLNPEHELVQIFFF